MSPPTSDSRDSDESIESEFEGERRKKVIIGSIILVLVLASFIGGLYYFGAMSAQGW